MSTERNRNIKMRKGRNLKRAKHQLKSLEEAFERDATARHKNISVRNALIIAQECVDKQIGKKPYKDNENGVYEKDHCPTCHRSLFPNDHHCECGQAIDWSDED